jgi:hypothetical protein
MREKIFGVRKCATYALLRHPQHWRHVVTVTPPVRMAAREQRTGPRLMEYKKGP